MVSFEAKVIDAQGFHARPASKISLLCKQFQSEIKMFNGDKSGSAKSIMNILGLGVKEGTNIKIEAQGEDEEQAIQEIKNLMIEEKLISL